MTATQESGGRLRSLDVGKVTHDTAIATHPDVIHSGSIILSERQEDGSFKGYGSVPEDFRVAYLGQYSNNGRNPATERYFVYDPQRVVVATFRYPDFESVDIVGKQLQKQEWQVEVGHGYKEGEKGMGSEAFPWVLLAHRERNGE